MRGFTAFLKKEWMEQVRTYHIWILLVVFLILGMMSPLTAKLTPEIVNMVDLAGMEITIPTPTAADSYLQFFKNNTFMGIVALVLVFGGTLANECSKGTLVNMLTKGLSRSAVLLSKFTMATLLWSGSILLCILVTFGYTVYLFPGETVINLPFAVFCLWLFGELLLALIMLFSTICNGSMGVLLGTAVTYVLLEVFYMFPPFQKFNPIALVSDNVAMLGEEYAFSGIYPVIWVTVVLIGVCLWGAAVLFGKKKI